ncbi:hypothetical protein JG551_003017 [Curtobacterium flaccumfaciens pv. flaccumfaciens]|uniref:hypothetical protein n=1 Tax=Curtobacterium flaccumfaciens TaxID=2035 RepID=UPI001BD0D5BB|nr:hypothetical protein [Curtobacterium flaccumfaciens]QVG65580.1 hypothetical protein JG551_003017 [Curtobacterium flaccumfaciens pv. flaccumfaciens]
MSSNRISAADLGLDMTTDEGVFGWLLASLLFGRPVQQEVAAHTWHLLLEAGYTTAEQLARADPMTLDHELWEGRYRRLVGVMTKEIGAVMTGVLEQFGSIAAMVDSSSSAAELERRLEQFHGVGPTTASIFVREIPAARYGAAAPSHAH